MTDEQRLSDALHRAVPRPPDEPERSSEINERVRRRRRRTSAGVVAAAAVLVAAAVAVPVALAGDDPGPVADPPPPTATATPDVELSCPPADQRPTGPGTLAVGATAVRLCPGPGIPVQAPADALTTGVDRLVEVINAQPESKGRPMCTMDLGPGYQLAFAYADGSVRRVTGELYGCHELRVGSATRTNPEIPYRHFIGALRAQRDTLEPPEDAAARPTCTTDSLLMSRSPVARFDEIVIATLCVRYPTAGESEPIGVAVPDDDLPVLLDDWVLDRPGSPYDPDAPTLLLLGETAWGDRTSRPVDGGRRIPGPQAQAILDRLVAEAGRPTPTVDASSSSEEVVAAYVDLLNAGDRAGAAALWHRLAGAPPIPEDYTRIDYKVEDVRPLRKISAYGDATAVTALYREVIRDAYSPYRAAVFTVGRDEDGVLRIVNLNVGEVVETGR